MDQDLGQPLPHAWGTVAMLVVVPALLSLPSGLLMMGDGGTRSVVGICLLLLTVLTWGGAWALSSIGVLVGSRSVSRTFGKRVLFTIPLDQVEQVDVRLRYGGVEVTAWTTREDGRRVGVYASPMAHTTTRPLLDALAPVVTARPEVLVTPGDRRNYATALKKA